MHVHGRHAWQALRPFIPELRAYNAASLRADLQAGLTVAIFAVPQAIAYALLAGVPPAHGLFAAMVMSAIAALWGSSRFLNTGPTNSAALLTAAAVAPFIHDPRLLTIVYTMTLLVGLFRLALGLLRMGVLVEFVPESAFLGFTVGAGILIAFGQLHHLLGVEPSHIAWFPQRLVDIVGRATDINPATLAIGLSVAAIMFATDRISRRIPVALIALALAAIASSLLSPTLAVPLVRDVVPLPSTLPVPTWPCLDLAVIHVLLPGALAVAIIGLIEAVSIGQSLALKHREEIDFDQEFIGQGLSHVVAAFLQGIPGSGSFSRSMLLECTGARTRLANVYFAGFTALALLLAPGLLNRIPISALAGMLIYIGIKLVDFRRIWRVVQTSWADAGVLVLTCLTTVLIKIEYGIFTGMLAAALIHLKRTRELHLAEIQPGPGHFEECAYEPGEAHAPSDVVAVAVSGDLFFGIAHELRRVLREIATAQRPRHLVLRVRRTYSIDYSCWSALLDFADAYQSEGGRLYLCGVRPDFERIIGHSHARAILAPSQVYPADSHIMRGFERCLADILTSLPANTTLSPRWQAYRVSLAQP
ncbi:MAG: SulP family inorganic anion transporter [Lentisphaerae bacterium]|nr:SulP family inorganic anion transporter [Lentisphaerota bacterium]